MQIWKFVLVKYVKVIYHITLTWICFDGKDLDLSKDTIDTESRFWYQLQYERQENLLVIYCSQVCLRSGHFVITIWNWQSLGHCSDIHWRRKICVSGDKQDIKSFTQPPLKNKLICETKAWSGYEENKVQKSIGSLNGEKTRRYG